MPLAYVFFANDGVDELFKHTKTPKKSFFSDINVHTYKVEEEQLAQDETRFFLPATLAFQTDRK